MVEHQYDKADEINFNHNSKNFNSTNLIIENDTIPEKDETEDERNCLDD